MLEASTWQMLDNIHSRMSDELSHTILGFLNYEAFTQKSDFLRLDNSCF
jgi:hypothetical protein